MRVHLFIHSLAAILFLYSFPLGLHVVLTIEFHVTLVTIDIEYFALLNLHGPFRVNSSCSVAIRR